jgi:LuxR family maltose regulon positive regulatory protein
VGQRDDGPCLSYFSTDEASPGARWNGGLTASGGPHEPDGARWEDLEGFGLGDSMLRVEADRALVEVGNQAGGRPAAKGGATESSACIGARFAVTKFRPTTLPSTLITRSALHDRLMTGAGQRLTLVAGSAGAGKSVLLSSWAAARPAGLTSWLSCDAADADPVRFWAGFIEAARAREPWFGADAADLLAMDGGVSADVTASIANDATMLPAGSAIVVDDFHYAAGSAARDMIALVERWPAETVQLVLSARVDPPLRLHRLRMASELCELHDRDLCFSQVESGELLANFGVRVAAADLALLHQRTEGWAAAVQMAALSLRGTQDPGRAARALSVRSYAIAEYFSDEVLDQQPAEVAQFMLDTCVLGELTADACAAVTGRTDAAELLHGIDAANLFVVALDEERTSFRYHHLAHQILRARLRARDPARERAVQLRAAEWFESTGDVRRAARHFLATKQAERALALLQDRVFSSFQRDPTLPPPPDLSMIDPSLFLDAPDRLLGLATDLLLSGDPVRGGEYLDLLEYAQPPIPPDSGLAARLAEGRAWRCMLTGRADEAVAEALAARATWERTQLQDDWSAAVPLILQSAYTWLEDYELVEREAAAALAAPELSEPVKQVLVPGARALAWLEAGHLAQAADAAAAAEAQAGRLGFGQHFFAVHYLRTLAGLALERRDLDAAEHLTEQALSISERGWPAFQFLALLDRAGIWAARGQVRDALTSIEAARLVPAGAGPVLQARADELEALLRLSLGDPRTPTELAGRLPAARRSLLLAQIALAAGNHHAAQQHLQSPPRDLTPRRALVRQLLLAATAIGRGDPMTAGIMVGALRTARLGGFLNTVVTTAPQVTSYLVEHSAPAHPDPFTEQVIGAALEVRAAQPDTCGSRRRPAEPLTAAELRVLKLLPTSTYPQIAAALYISRSTVKTHLQSVYHKLGVASRSEAIERAVDLCLL